MSDQALAWKAAFGAVVMLFCAVTYVSRKPVADAPSVSTQAAAPIAPMAALPQSADAAPLDVQEDTPPVRIEVTLNEPQPVPKALVRARPHPVQKLRPAKTPQPRIHTVAARRKASPYAIGRKHYPYDPRERWAFREAP